MTTLIHFAGPDLVDLLEQIRMDQQGFETECRNAHREPVVMPVEIESSVDDTGVEAFTRNVSSEGLCIIAPQPFSPTSQAKIRLASESVPHSVVSTCRWNKKFGLSYWISGWSLDAKLPMGRILKEDGKAEPPLASIDSLHTAVPVSVQQDTTPKRISAFTRNLSAQRVSLVSKVPFEPNLPAVLEIRRLNGQSSGTIAHCVWSKSYGRDHWISRWEFAQAPQ